MVALEVRPDAVLVRELLASGMTRNDVKRAIQRRQYIALRRGLLVDAELWKSSDASQRHEIALRGLVRSNKASFASHDSAARLLGLPTDQEPQEFDGIPICHITQPGQSRVDRWVVVHGCVVPDALVETVRGIPSSGLVRASIEQAATAYLGRAAAFIDAAMRQSIDARRGEIELRDAVRDLKLRRQVRQMWHSGLDHFVRHRWVTRVRFAVKHSDPASESYLESESRMVMILGEIPLPECGVPIRAHGRQYWADFCWKSERLIGEADGLEKYEIPGSLERQEQREAALRSAGWRVVRWGWNEAVVEPTLLLRLLTDALSSSK